MKREGILCFLKKDNEVLLIKVDYGDKVVWNGVSGYVDDGELRAQAVVREVQEEVGVELKSQGLEYQNKVKISDELELHVYTASHWDGSPVPREASILDISWFNIENLPYESMFPGTQKLLPAILK